MQLEETLDERNLKKPDKVALQAKLELWRNTGNKTFSKIKELKAFDHVKVNYNTLLNDYPGIFDVLTNHVNLLNLILFEEVPSWRSQIDSGLLFKKLHSSVSTFRNNAQKQL